MLGGIMCAGVVCEDILFCSDYIVCALLYNECSEEQQLYA